MYFVHMIAFSILHCDILDSVYSVAKLSICYVQRVHFTN